MLSARYYGTVTYGSPLCVLAWGYPLTYLSLNMYEDIYSRRRIIRDSWVALTLSSRLPIQYPQALELP